LLSKVLCQVRIDNLTGEDIQSSIQIQGALSSFRAGLWSELLNQRGFDATQGHHISLFTPIAIALSAEHLLYFTYSCADYDSPATIGIPPQIEMQRISITGLRDLFILIQDFARLVCESCSFGKVSAIGPFLGDCFYQAARSAMLYIRETGDQQCQAGLVGILKALEMLGSRWTVASTFHCSFETPRPFD
jgi:hypothetical protein